MEKKVFVQEVKRIRKKIEQEFPGDPALQEVHIARKIISKEAEIEGMSLGKYIRFLELKREELEKQSS